MDLTEALKIYWIEGSIQSAQLAVGGDEYSNKYMIASSIHGYSQLKVSVKIV